MNNSQLANKVATCSEKQLIKRHSLLFIIFSFAGLLFLLYADKDIPKVDLTALRKLADEPTLINSEIKKYSVNEIKKHSSTDNLYSVTLVGDIKRQTIVLHVVPGSEQAMIDEARTGTLELSYSSQLNKILPIYPHLDKARPLIKKALSELDELSFNQITAQADNVFFMFAIVLVVMFFSYHNAIRRRKIFLMNFKNIDLELAPKATIERVTPGLIQILNTKFGKVWQWQGNVYRLKSEKQKYVIYNQSSSNTITGVLLSYKGHYYFFSDRLVNQLRSKRKVA